MKNKRDKNFLILVWNTGVFCFPITVHAQKDSAAKPERQSLIYLQYHVKNNEIPYLYVQTKNKLENAFLPAANSTVTIYMDNDMQKDALIGKLVTNEKGEGSIGLPPSASQQWTQKTTHSFFAHSDSSASFGPATKEVNVTIARLVLDTAASENGRTLVARLEKKEGSNWVPVTGVDIRIGAKRYGGVLNAGDKDTYTTDSTGKAEADFQLKDLPGDQTGKLEVVAILDDNDEVGTMETSLVVPWGIASTYKSEFGTRSLWSTARRAPWWLVVMAYGCIITVWSVIIYLFTRIRLIRKLGRSG